MGGNAKYVDRDVTTPEGGINGSRAGFDEELLFSACCNAAIAAETTSLVCLDAEAVANNVGDRLRVSAVASSSAVMVRRRLDSDVAAILRPNAADLTNHSAAESSGSVEAIANGRKFLVQSAAVCSSVDADVLGVGRRNDGCCEVSSTE